MLKKNTNPLNDDYDKKSKEIFRLLNEFRKNPKTLVKHLESLKKFLDTKTNILSEPGKIQMQMIEGENIFNEAIKFLNGLGPLEPLTLDERLCKSANEHVQDIGPKGLLSYQSSCGTEPEERISKFGNYVESLGENIDFGPNDAMGVLVSLTLDDGEAERPHRDNLFKADYKKVGIACGPHKTEYQICVMDFAFDFLPLNSVTDELFQTQISNSYAKNQQQTNPEVVNSNRKTPDKNSPSYNEDRANFINNQIQNNNEKNANYGYNSKNNNANPSVNKIYNTNVLGCEVILRQKRKFS